MPEDLQKLNRKGIRPIKNFIEHLAVHCLHIEMLKRSFLREVFQGGFLLQWPGDGGHWSVRGTTRGLRAGGDTTAQPSLGPAGVGLEWQRRRSVLDPEPSACPRLPM